MKEWRAAFWAASFVCIYGSDVVAVVYYDDNKRKRENEVRKSNRGYHYPYLLARAIQLFLGIEKFSLR